MIESYRLRFDSLVSNTSPFKLLSALTGVAYGDNSFTWTCNLVPKLMSHSRLIALFVVVADLLGGFLWLHKEGFH